MITCSPELYSKVSFAAAESYIRDVESGAIRVNIWILAAIERGKSDKASGRWRLDYDVVDACFQFCSRLSIPNSLGKVEQFRLSSWQSWALMELFLYYDKETGARRYTEIVLFMGRKNGKTMWAAIISFFLSLEGNYSAPEVYFAASGLKQAGLLLKYCKQVARYSEYLKVRTVENQYAIKTKNMGLLSAISARVDGSNDGLKPLISVLDECHSMKNNELRSALLTGMGWSMDTLLISISTAGQNIVNYFYRQIKHGKMILQMDPTVDDKTFYLLFTLDDGDLDRVDLQTNSDLWMKANPNLGITPPLAKFKSDMDKAFLMQDERQQFILKNLNVFSDEINADRLFSMTDINRNSKKLDISEFYGCTIYMGLDLAPKLDISSLGIILEKDGVFYSWVDLFVAGSREALNRAGTKVSLLDYKEHLNIAWNSEVQDYDAIVDRVNYYLDHFRIAGVGYDPAFSSTIMSRITRLGVDIYIVKSFPASFNEPIMMIENALATDNMVIDNNPILKYMFYNCLGGTNTQGLRFPDKKESKIYGDAIDGVISILNAFNVYIGENVTHSAIYEFRNRASLKLMDN